MGSILTNNSAMVALQTLNSINRNLGEVQSQISTGFKVANAKDNAAVFAISQVMRSDVAGFQALSETLSLGQSTVAVASNAAKSVGDLLNEIKGKIVAASEDNVDRTKLQEELVSLRNQIGSVVGAAQFNGLNLLSNTETDAGSGSSNVIASLDRAADQSVSTTEIEVAKQDLGTGDSAIAATGGTFSNDTGTSAVTLNATQTGSIDIGTDNAGFDAGTAYAINIFGTDADNSSFTQADLRTSTAAASTQAEAAANSIKYVTRDGDTASDVASALNEQLKLFFANNGIDSSVASVSVSGDTLTFTSTVTDATDTLQFNLASVTADASNTIGGGLEILGDIDISTEDGAGAALTAVEGLIQTTINAQAALGTVENRIEIQNDFMSSLISSFKSGIGSLVDADLEEASARLQSLQVQQQLGVQSLSIANQQPQTILSLFR